NSPPPLDTPHRGTPPAQHLAPQGDDTKPPQVPSELSILPR
ncbi:hypothetical protein HMPREF0058_1125, partial [Actinomyces urogenitalis DSM 15434]